MARILTESVIILATIAQRTTGSVSDSARKSGDQPRPVQRLERAGASMIIYLPLYWRTTLPSFELPISRMFFDIALKEGVFVGEDLIITGPRRTLAVLPAIDKMG